ncbi:unnamed protein product [Owenia fusiformis]|uniref:Uncharacterized protein n=1 Tax=Owenia fusiformis TaxID=6347 RepID=A0A8J1U4X2_OWEFU|nr:unnamed protein product [Owenia fusiformis]
MVSIRICTLLLIGQNMLWVKGHGDDHTHEIDPDDPDAVNKILQDTEHMKEHYEGKADTVDWSQLDENEKLFHFFRINDYDDNNKLDGLELYKGFSHFMGNYRMPNLGLKGEEKEKMEDKIRNNRHNSIMNIVDDFMKDDWGNDGFLNYQEYVRAQERRDEAKKNRKYGDRSMPQY